MDPYVGYQGGSWGNGPNGMNRDDAVHGTRAVPWVPAALGTVTLVSGPAGGGGEEKAKVGKEKVNKK